MTQEQWARISSDPNVLHGQAVLSGTRIPVSVVLDCLATGMTVEQIVTEYPALDSTAVLAAIAYAAQLAREELIPLAPR
ncbi:MAG TPA: DUF433 domain-containing protein [Sporichthyaceae bacterium]|jgi:uncharacterized protein (DUF433 family)|nr:DUF433 domain-containing protein [Sporichthyaceae bacterium]